jgi:hypothetical protein
VIGRSMTAPAECVIAQEYSSFTFVSLRFNSQHGKNSARVKDVIISTFFTSLKLRKSEIALT